MSTRKALNTAKQTHALAEPRTREGRGQDACMVLNEAVDKGWADIDAGRYVDITDEQLEFVIAQLGRRAAERATPRKP